MDVTFSLPGGTRVDGRVGPFTIATDQPPSSTAPSPFILFLASIGACMCDLLRSSDVKCRYGGEEFLIVLFDTRLEGARHVAHTLRRQLELHRVRWQQHSIAMTASFGVTTVLPGETDPMPVLARADAALYRAKQAGRNCVRHVTDGAAAGAAAQDARTGAPAEVLLLSARSIPLSGR